jgi:nucleoside 2-deoxyribosyltransferase
LRFVVKKIYLIMPVRASTEAARILAEQHLKLMESIGHDVHFPPRDAPQSDETGRAICETHLAAMRACDEVHVLWDAESKGSHFDLGMAYAMGKSVVPVGRIHEDPPGKSYWKAVIAPPDA